MLLGQFEHTIDDKNRLTLPARFRDRFSEGIVVTPGIDPCLWAYPRGDWQQLAETRLASLDPLNQESRRIRRYFFAAAQDAELDRQGRVILPASLVGHAKLKREVVVAGVYDHLEIWDRAAWRAELEEVEGSAEHVAERLATRRE
jgi:MraZ protein